VRCYKNPTRVGFAFIISVGKNSCKSSLQLMNLKLKDWNVVWFLDQLNIG